MKVIANPKRGEFETSLISLMPWIRLKAWNLTQNREEAEDLSGDTILKALENKNRYNYDCPIRPWLWVIMNNLFINLCREKRLRIEKREYLRQIPQELTPDLDTSDQLEKIMKVTETHVSVKCAVQYAEGYSYKEIAEFWNIPEGTVRSRLCYARRNFLPRFLNR